MNQNNREQTIVKLQGHLKGATITVHEIEELLLSQEHIIWMQQKEIDDLKKRLKQLESLDIQNEQILHFQNINVQLKTQIEFLKSQIQEKDALIAQFTLKPLSGPSTEMLAAQQQLIQQNLVLQNIIGDLQNQILNKDGVISQLKTQESSLDHLIGQLSANIQIKRSQVGSAEKQKDIQNALNELQTYPEALQEVVQRIIQEYKRISFLIDEKEIEINNLRARLQMQQQKANDSIQEIIKRNPSSFEESRANELIQQNATMEDAISDLERRLISQENRKKELQQKLIEIGTDILQLEEQNNKNNQFNVLDEFNKTEFRQSQQQPNLAEMTFQQQTKDQTFQLQCVPTEQQIDELVSQNQQQDDLIVELQRKLVEKQDQQEEIQLEIDKIDVISLMQELQKLNQQCDKLKKDIEEKDNQLKLLEKQNMELSNVSNELKQSIKIKQEQIDKLYQEEQEKLNLQDALQKHIEYQRDIQQKQQQIDELKLQKENVENELKNVVTQMDDKNIKVEKWNQLQNDQYQKAQIADDLVQQILELDELIQNLEVKLEEKKDSQSQFEKELKDINSKLQTIQESIQIAKTQRIQLENEFNQQKLCGEKLMDNIQELLVDIKNNEIKLEKLQLQEKEQQNIIKELQFNIEKLTEEENQLRQYKENCNIQNDQIQILEKNIEENKKNIFNLKVENNLLQQSMDEIEQEHQKLLSKKLNIENEISQQQIITNNLAQHLETLFTDIKSQEILKQEKEQQLKQLKTQIDSIIIEDQVALLQEKLESQREQNALIEEIERLKYRFENIKQQQQNIELLIENQMNLNQELSEDLLKFKLIGNQLESELHSLTAQQEEMKYQIKEKSSQLENLNEQFTKIDEEGQMMEAVLSLKQKELKQIQQKKENFTKELDQITQEIFDLKKEIALRRKYQQQQNKVDLNQNEDDIEDEIQGKLNVLNTKNNDLKDDLQKLVELSPIPQEQKLNDVSAQISQFNDQQAQKILKDRDKRIEILELTIQTLQQQNHEKNSMMPSLVSKITQQQSFFFEDDPILGELSEKFTKESQLLLDLQNKLRKTAERHYDLSVKLQEWAEKENRLANELNTRTQCVEKIEQELQKVFDKQSDLESDQVNILQRIYQLETENQELLESEANTKNKLKEKKDYIQVLYKNLVEMDQKLLQLRNRMALYSQEGRQLAELVGNQENERENQMSNLQTIKEELEQIELEKKEKLLLIQSIKKEIQNDTQEKEKLELEFITLHSKNSQLKAQIGFEEAVYQKLLQEFEIMKKKDQIKYKNLYKDGCTQIEYEQDQFESLINEMQFSKITKEEVLFLKQNCQQKLNLLTQNDGNQQYFNNNQILKKILHLQQLLIKCQENENKILIEHNSNRSSVLGFRVLDENAQNQTFTLEQIDQFQYKTTIVEIHLNDQCLIIESTNNKEQKHLQQQKMARQWILDKHFDSNNDLYPLGILHIVFKVSIYQVINIALTGTKVLQLYQLLL
ncbi:unnamed protein product [Paramecium pentaurelia]|uniref:Uncharacterized protein n=1 Tax=Paramecium pentaurelia TaxID=43138 RepID=A0A8S1SC26_9CILI|nr:unnamed protein product [Paramecium pentaurelia]